MNRIVRRRLDMAVRARDFSRAHPSTDATYAPVLGRLEEAVNRIERLARQEQDGQLTRRASAARRRGLRRRLHHDLLRHLVTVAHLAAEEEPGLTQLFRLPDGNWSNEKFRTAARRMLDDGRGRAELFARYGLAEKLLDDLTAAVDDFDASVVESNEGRREHVGARAELKAVSDEVLRLVETLDGLNRYRFAGNAELRAAWDSARNVLSGPKPKEEPDTPAAGGDVRPAA
jgi:hypothetical protein